MFKEYPLQIQHILHEAYAHGRYDERLEQSQCSNATARWASDALDRMDRVHIDSVALKRSRLFMNVAGLESMYYFMLLQCEQIGKNNHRCAMSSRSIWHWLWGIKPTPYAVPVAEPKMVWMEKFAYEMAKALREAKVVADVNIEVHDEKGRQHIMHTSAKTWLEDSKQAKETSNDS